MADRAIKYSANSLDFAQKVAGFSAKAAELKAPFSGRPGSTQESARSM